MKCSIAYYDADGLLTHSAENQSVMDDIPQLEAWVVASIKQGSGFINQLLWNRNGYIVINSDSDDPINYLRIFDCKKLRGDYERGVLNGD